MDEAGLDIQEAVNVAGVAPGTLIAQISVALIAVAVTAVYILKHLPDTPEENPGTRSRDHRDERSQRNAHSLEGFGENTRAGNGEHIDSGASTSQTTGESEWATSHSSSLEEYRAIISDEDYQDLCSTHDEQTKSSMRKGSKEWPTSLESIDEEDEEEVIKTERDTQDRDEPKPKQSPTRGSRVPKWYFSKSSSGIPTSPKCRDLEEQFDQLANKHSGEYIDEARKTAITGFRGIPIGIVQRKPWPKDESTSSINPHEYAITHNDIRSFSQSEAAGLDHVNIARQNFLLKGQVNAPLNNDQVKIIYVPEIRIHEPNSNDVSSTDDGIDSGEAVRGAAEWVEILASTVHLPEKSQDEVTAEVVQMIVDDDDEEDNDEVPTEGPTGIDRTTPTPRPRTRIAYNRPGISYSTSQLESAPPLVVNMPTRNIFEIEKPKSDIDRNQRGERAVNIDAEQPSTNANEGLYKQTKHSDLMTMKSDATHQLGVQTKSDFIERGNIDSTENNDNSSPSLALCGKTYTALTDARAFTVVGCKLNRSETSDINSTPDSDIAVTHTDSHETPRGQAAQRVQLVTSRSPYEIGIPSLSTKRSSDEDSKQRVNSAEITAQPESRHIDQQKEERDKLFVAIDSNTGGRLLESKTQPDTDGQANHTFTDGLGNELERGFSQNGETEDEKIELDDLRATLTDTLPLKRPKELGLLLNGTSNNEDLSVGRSDISNSKGPSDSELSAASPSEVISEQLERIRKSLDKLKVPDWYKKSSHYQRVVNKRHNVKSDIDSEPRMTRSPSSCLSDCCSATSSEDVASLPTVWTKLAFQSEARYRRDFPTSFFNETIRNAFSCVELPTQSSQADDDPLNYSSLVDTNQTCQSADDTLYSQPFNNQTSSSLQDVNYDTPRTQLSPSHGLRLRSKSLGDNLDQITYFDSLAVKRLERHMNDSIFFVTGYLCDLEDENLDDSIQSDRNSLFASGSLPDESIDEMEYRRQMYSTTGSYTRDLPSQISSQSDNLSKGNGYINRGNNNITNDNYLESTHSTPTASRSPGSSNVHYGHESTDVQSPRTPIPAPRRNIMGSSIVRGHPDLTDSHQGEELKPDPRYNPDGSKNIKISPKFAMVIPTQTHRARESPKNSPRNTSPRRTNVKILVTDTTLEDDDSDPSFEQQSDQDQVSSSDQETVVDGTTSWTPLDLDKLKDSEFAAVVSVITSRHMQPGNRSGLYLPGSGYVPQREVTMEEIVDSLLGLPYQRATSAVDLNSSGYRGSSSTSSPLTSSTPDLSSSWSASRGSTPVSSSDKSHSVDSLYGEGDSNVLNAIIFGRKIIEGDGYPSYEDDGEDAVGDEIIMVKCSYKKCAKTKELTEARKSYKTCHNCYTYYCSRQCRKMHWPRHKKRCLFGRVNSACKHVLYHSRYNGQLQSDLSRVARTGYLSRGRGAILLIFPDTEAAENYTEKGFDALPNPPTYSTVRELENSDLFGDHMKFLLEMCCSYDPDTKFVINIAIMASGEQYRGHRPRLTDMSVKKCAKLKLSMMNPSKKEADPVPDTLILTSPTGAQGDGVLDRKARQVCFVHIQRQLRQRGVSLRHQHAEIYDKLCRWVEEHEHFIPVTIYPVDERTGQRFMCVLMPESEPNELEWINNPELLEDIDLDAELEKLENVAGLVVTDL